MELLLLINGQKCQVKFERHHTFERVLGLLKDNKLIPSNLSLDRVQIQGINGKTYTKNNFVNECMVAPETNKCEVRIKFSNVSPQSSLVSKESMVEAPGAKKAKMADIVKSFFQKMQKREFRKLEKYQNHQDEIISLVAKFTKTYEKLYALHLYYKAKIIKLNCQEEKQLKEYRERFRQELERVDKENVYRSHQSIQNDSVYQQKSSVLHMEIRDSIDKEKFILTLESQLQTKQMKINEIKQERDQLASESKELRVQIMEWKLKYERLYDQIKNQIVSKERIMKKLQEEIFEKERKIVSNSKIDSQIEFEKVESELNKRIKQLQDTIAAKNKTVDQHKYKYQRCIDDFYNSKKLYEEEITYLKQRNDALQQQISKINQNHLQSAQNSLENLQSQNQILQITIQELRQQLKKERFLQISLQELQQQLRKEKQLNLQLERQKQSAFKQQQLEKQQLNDRKNELSQQLRQLRAKLIEIQETNNNLKIQNPRIEKMNFLRLNSKKSKQSLEQITFQPPESKLNECFQQQIAGQFCQKMQLYLKKKLVNISSLLYHPSDLKFPAKKILKQIKGKENLLLICLTAQKKVIGGFTSLPIDSECSAQEISNCKAFLFNIERQKVNIFSVKNKKKPVIYDQNFLIFGLEDISLDYETLMICSRFVSTSSLENVSFSDTIGRRKYFLSEKQSQKVQLASYWLFKCTLE